MNDPFGIFHLVNSPGQVIDHPESVKFLPEGYACVITKNPSGVVRMVAIFISQFDAMEILPAFGETAFVLVAQSWYIHNPVKNKGYPNLQAALVDALTP